MPAIITTTPVGELRALTNNSTIPDGYKLCDGTTIGSALSGAGSASVYNYRLFVHMWTNYTDAQSPIFTSGGGGSTRGGSADADWAADKRITLPNMGSGKSPISRGGGYTFGDSGGISTVVLTSAQSGVGLHAHGMGAGANDATTVQIGVQRFANFYNDIYAFPPTQSTNNNSAANAVAAHENMPPYHVVSWVIRAN